MTSTLKILSIDGGGIRGLIPASIINYIESQTGKPAAELFDLVAGTSTGGILAMGLATPDDLGKPKYTALELIELYEKNGPAIFSRSIWRDIRTIDGLREDKYPAFGVETVLKDYFGKTLLSEALIETLITSYDVERRRPHIFKSRHAKNGRKDHNLLMWEIARATSAAPTYFEAKKIEVNPPQDYLALIDGGVFANDPSMCAYAEARRFYPDHEVLMLSLGTGKYTTPLFYDRIKDWGMLAWASEILDVIMDGAVEAVQYQMEQLLNADSTKPNFYRFQAKLNETNEALDDASERNTRELQLLAEELIATNRRELDEICQRLTEEDHSTA